MIRTVLLDLDDTLLINSMDSFLPAYFQRLGAYLSDVADPDRMLAALMAGTQAMLANDDPSQRLERVFGDIFYPQLGLDEHALQERIDHFYTQIFPELQPLTEVYPGAKQFVEHLFANEYEVVIATNPLFPRLAIEARLRWAEIPVEEWDFAVVTSLENFHFTKSTPAYFTEILGLLGRPLSEAVMIGNEIGNDLEPAELLGIPVFHLHNQPDRNYPGGDFLAAEEWLKNASDQVDTHAQREPESLIARLKGHLAALHTLSEHVESQQWRIRPEPEEWAPIEILAHLDDVERKVNLPRLQQFMDGPDPHLTAFDTDAWAAQRSYIDYEPEATLADFNGARKDLIAQLQKLDDAEWQLDGIHALLGPTTLAEVIHFAAEHDLIHLEQMRRTIGYPG
ncbi:MAG: DinB family protein [Anaerolineales bacterium]|jgi:FMN phosphatase YigB (HAD superfamily)